MELIGIILIVAGAGMLFFLAKEIKEYLNG